MSNEGEKNYLYKYLNNICTKTLKRILQVLNTREYIIPFISSHKRNS